MNFTKFVAVSLHGYYYLATCMDTIVDITLPLPKCCNFTPRNVHERFQTLLTPVPTIFTDFLSAVVTSKIAQILSLYGGGFIALKWQSGSGFALILL